MKHSIATSTEIKAYNQNLKVTITGMLILLPLYLVAINLEAISPSASQLLLLFNGWLLWTFIEYYNHCFRMHGKGNKEKIPGYEEHIEHHHHPTDIKITSRHRLLLII